MKPLIKLLPLLLLWQNSFARQTEPLNTKPATDYMMKSKRQKTAAIVLAASGGTFIITAFAIPKGEFVGYTADLKEDYRNDGIKATFFLVGAASTLASVPFFILSGKNRRRAMNTGIFFKMEEMLVLQENMTSDRICPAVGLRVYFN